MTKYTSIAGCIICLVRFIFFQKLNSCTNMRNFCKRVISLRGAIWCKGYNIYINIPWGKEDERKTCFSSVLQKMSKFVDFYIMRVELETNSISVKFVFPLNLLNWTFLRYTFIRLISPSENFNVLQIHS